MPASPQRFLDRQYSSIAGSARSRAFCLAIIFVSVCASGLSALNPPDEPRRVLVLYSYSRHLPWEAKVSDGIDEILDALKPAERPVLFEEGLDSDRLGDIGPTEAWADYLAVKYKNIRLDAIVSESQQAAGLLFGSPELFPGVSRYILNCAPSSLVDYRDGIERRYSSVSNIEQAVRTIVNVLPETRRIIVVADRSAVGKARTAQALEIGRASCRERV